MVASLWWIRECVPLSLTEHSGHLKTRATCPCISITVYMTRRTGFWCQKNAQQFLCISQVYVWGRKKGTDTEIANGSKVPVSLGYSWLFRHQSLFAPLFLSVTSAIRNADEVEKSESGFCFSLPKRNVIHSFPGAPKSHTYRNDPLWRTREGTPTEARH